MAAQLHIPVIGAGSIGTRHYQNLVALNISSELLSMRATGLGGVETLLQQGAADGLVIATATDVRLELIALCAQYDVPMYIEKPLAFEAAQITELYKRCSQALQRRSIAGYMMRYHPLFRWLCEQDLTDTYRFTLTIGHDVTQWRQHWSFADSYASNPQGGGVLLDLCHELDMAHTLFPHAVINQVNCLGHDNFPGVDFNTEVILGGSGGAFGHVSMDYLSPVSTRVATFFGRNAMIQVDFNALSTVRNDGQHPQTGVIEFERNDMFIDAMRDFLSLIKGEAVADHCPRLDRVQHSAAFIADAWQQRQFNGNLSHSVL